jgi:hypothetical protein
MVMHMCNLSSVTGNGRILVRGPSLAKSARPYMKNKLKQKGWRQDLSSRALA